MALIYKRKKMLMVLMLMQNQVPSTHDVTVNFVEKFSIGRKLISI